MPDRGATNRLAYAVAGSGPPLDPAPRALRLRSLVEPQHSRLRGALSDLHGRSARIRGESRASAGRGSTTPRTGLPTGWTDEGLRASQHRRALSRRRRRGAARRAPSGLASSGSCSSMPRSGRTACARPRAWPMWCTTISRRSPGFAPLLPARSAALPSLERHRRHSRHAAGRLGTASDPDHRADARRLGRARSDHAPCARATGLPSRFPVRASSAWRDAGHNPMWECADAFNDEVLRFLRHGRARHPRSGHGRSSRRAPRLSRCGAAP